MDSMKVEYCFGKHAAAHKLGVLEMNYSHKISPKKVKDALSGL